MSWEVGGIVSRKQCGGAVRRVVLLAMAGIAGNRVRVEADTTQGTVRTAERLSVA